jgi:hypothetical protein
MQRNATRFFGPSAQGEAASPVRIEKLSLGVGDSFGRQAKAQLGACTRHVTGNLWERQIGPLFWMT